jgi:hypothetical protein
VLCCLESCRAVKLRSGEGKPRLAFTRRPQRVLYYYFLDPEFGRVQVRIETWFPFTIQIYVNGHDWLAQQLAKKRAGFNPARREDIQFFRAVLRGEHELRGFRNADLSRLLQLDGRNPEQRRRNRAAIGRRLKRLHVRGLVAKIPHTRRWKVTPLGHRTIGVCVQLYYHGLAIAA